MAIPLVDLKAQYSTIKEEIDDTIRKVLDNTAFIGGTVVKEFEEAFAARFNAAECIGVGNGTDALYIAMRALGIGPGDEVITAANSFVATSEAITMTGARVVFADVAPVTYTIDPEKIRQNITPKTKAILPVHLYGHPADMNPIREIADQHKLHIIEDCAQAHLAEYRGKKIGTIGDIGCFSFYPGKNLGAYGDGGAMITNDLNLAAKARMTANHGRISKYDHEFEGVNSRLDGLQAAILSVKLNYLPEWTDSRRRVASRYNELLHNLDDVVLPVEAESVRHVYHLYVIQAPDRDRLQEHLKENNISSGIHYPIALPNLMAYRYLMHSPSDFPVASSLQDSILSLPMFPELQETDINHITKCIRSFYKR